MKKVRFSLLIAIAIILLAAIPYPAGDSVTGSPGSAVTLNDTTRMNLVVLEVVEVVDRVRTINVRLTDC